MTNIAFVYANIAMVGATVVKRDIQSNSFEARLERECLATLRSDLLPFSIVFHCSSCPEAIDLMFSLSSPSTKVNKLNVCLDV